MRYLRPLLGACASVSLLVFGAACGGGDAAPKPAPATSIPGAANVTANTPAPAAAANTPNGANFNMNEATTTPSGLKYVEVTVGTGESPKMEQTVVVHYTGKLASDGKVFDSSVTRGQPATFPLRGVIPGFSEGILTMKAGGKRTVYIPAALAYGARPPAGSGIPANADLVFEIELISFK